MDISDYRREYTRSGLHRADLADNPVSQFEKWFEQATRANITDPNAMTLATVSADCKPSARTVLLKTFDQKGFVFFTNYGSQKAREIEANPHVCLLFPWTELERQVEIAGRAEKISTAESMKYFLTRPHGSQLGAWVSNQSNVITSRKILDMKLDEMKHKFKDGKVPLPDFWGGYRVVPDVVEFWQGRPNRLHDRFEYRRNESHWEIARLAP